jgi:hypothetical protein
MKKNKKKKTEFEPWNVFSGENRSRPSPIPWAMVGVGLTNGSSVFEQPTPSFPGQRTGRGVLIPTRVEYPTKSSRR